ncbi:hypothetical protein [Peribacillus acanthi]|uniref:YkvI family membrane protein n=1 Tax=Peribacillus acanthi TaxID=2171554 RepID=UPI000D3E1751|nr:hypothetical protein [Peribacillus acanthi]
MKGRWSGAFQIAAVYVGTVVGAGFATGKEIVEFFSKYGLFGTLCVLVAGFIFIYFGTKMMLLALRTKSASYQELNEHLFGRRLSSFINLLFFIMLMGVTSVMFSGAGAVFDEQLGIGKTTGIFLTMILSFIVLSFGVKGLFAVNSFVVPVMIFFSVLLCVVSVSQGDYRSHFFAIPESIPIWKMMLSPLSYAAFNLALAQAVLVPVANDIKDEKIVKAGGILGGLLLTIILLSSHLSLITLPNVAGYEIPTAEVMKFLAPQFYWIYIFIIYGEIFTSIIGNSFGLERQLKPILKIRGSVIIVGIFGVSFLISKIQYGILLSFLYPLFGYISIVFLFLLFRDHSTAKIT